MKREIESELAVLVGEAFWSPRRAGNLLLLEFGPQKRFKNHRGEWVTGGRFALHVSCPWRISIRREMLVGAEDVYLPPSDMRKTPRGWQWETGRTRFTEQVLRWLPARSEPIAVVQSIRADRFGGFHLSMSGSVGLDVFPCCTADYDLLSEEWRFFVARSRKRHFVVSFRTAGRV